MTAMNEMSINIKSLVASPKAIHTPIMRMAFDYVGEHYLSLFTGVEVAEPFEAEACVTLR